MSSTNRESLRRKRCARLAAVQGVYQFAQAEPKPRLEKLIERLTQQWKDSLANADEDWPGDAMPEPALLKATLEGTLTQLEAIDTHMQLIIKENWKPERMDPVMRAILRCAIYELAFQPERKIEIILDEYVSIAGSFFDDPELGYTHSALQTLAPKLRA